MDRGIWRKAREGDKESEKQIVDKYYRLAYAAAHDWVKKGVIPFDDAVSEANMALVKCIRGGFDPEKGKFTSYLVRAVDNQIRMYLRAEKKHTQFDYADNTIVLEDGTIDALEEVADVTCVVEEQVEQILLFEYVMSRTEGVTEKEMLCLRLRSRGLTCDEIGIFLGMSRQYVSRLSNSAVEKIRDQMAKDEQLDVDVEGCSC